MKKYTIFYHTEDNRLDSWTYESNRATFMNVIKHFTSTMNVSSDCINSIHTEQVEAEELTYDQKQAYYNEQEELEQQSIHPPYHHL